MIHRVGKVLRLEGKPRVRRVHHAADPGHLSVEPVSGEELTRLMAKLMNRPPALLARDTPALAP